MEIRANNELYVLVLFPDCQELEGKDGFDNNSYPLIAEDFAIPGYFVNKEWYDSVNYQDYIETVTNE